MIFDIILQIIGLASLAHLLVDFIETLDRKDFLPHKPWKCDLCMGSWISVIPLMLLHGVWGIPLAATVGVVADLIFRLKNRL